MSTVLRGARLATRTKKEVVDFISSRENDRRIARSIVLVNEAHLVALAKANLVSKREASKLLRELRKLEDHFPNKGIEEDYHLFIEQKLVKKLGAELGGKIHTGKSRNDQVATAIRLSLRDSLLGLSDMLLSFVDKLLRQASRYIDSLFVGYTHLRPAQPITYGHYLVAVADSFLRDHDRILDAYRRVNLSPMGAGALAGSSFNLDRRLVANLLGFDGLVENSLDAVGSRDFLLESLGVCSLVASDLSRVAEDLIFYGSVEVNLIDISDEYSSASSIMPQKKNPDPLEVARARCAEVGGNYTTALSMMHALPSGYNLDFQEITPLIWRSIDTLHSSMSVMAGVIAGVRPRQDIADRYQVNFTVATEIANCLVREIGVPFREAYRQVGQAVRIALHDQKVLRDISLAEWNKTTGGRVNEKTLRRLREIADPRSNPDIYRTEGSPNPREVNRMIRSRRQRVMADLQTTRKMTAQSDRATHRLGRVLQLI